MKLLLSLAALATTPLVYAQGPCDMDVTLGCRTVDGGIPCTEIQARTTNCFVAIQWDVLVRNNGSMLQVSQLDLLTDNTNRNMLVLSLPINPIPMAQEAGMSPIYEINVCDTPLSHTASLAASAVATIGGGTCNGQQEFSFTVGRSVGDRIPQPPPVPAPTPQPVFVPAPVSIPQPVPAPTTPEPQEEEVPQEEVAQPEATQEEVARTDGGGDDDDDSVICGRIEGFIECALANGQSCNTLVPRETDCTEELFYTLTLRNTGEAPLELSTANLIADSVPEPIDVLSNLSTLNFAGGESAAAIVQAPIDTCGPIIAFNANAEIRAMHPVGTNCRPGPPPPPAPETIPAPAPIPDTLPAPVPDTLPLPAAPRAIADCELEVRIECRLADGNACNSIVGGEGAENCFVSFFYDIFLDNTGTVDMPVTSALFSNGADSMVDEALELSANPVPAGETSFASISTVIDVCAGPLDAQGRVDVETQPPMDVRCSHLIPSPTTVFVGGPAPSPTDSAAATEGGTTTDGTSTTSTTTSDPIPVRVDLPTPEVVDCIIDSRLEGCTLADNSPCQDLNVDATGCIVTFFYGVALENMGTVELTVTTATLETNGESLNVLDHTPSDQLAIGQVRQARVPVELDVCNTNSFSALVSTRAVPPEGFVCR